MKFWSIIPISARFCQSSVLELKDVVRKLLDKKYFQDMNSKLKSRKDKLVDEIERSNTEVSARYI